jgi:tRNA modification GTPase
LPRANTASAEPTVARVASPPGEGGVAVIEVVGPAAEAQVARRFSRPLPKPGRLAVGRLVDDVIIRVISPTKSPYGEATVEIS